MLKRICDICGKDHETQTFVLPSGMYGWKENVEYGSDGITIRQIDDPLIVKSNMDLCKECSQKILEFMISLKGEYYQTNRERGVKTSMLIKGSR